MEPYIKTKIGETIIVRNGQVLTQSGFERITIGDVEFEVNFPVTIYVDGDIDGHVKSVAGSVHVTGNCLDVKSVSGDVNVTGSVRGSASSVSGDVRIRS